MRRLAATVLAAALLAVPSQAAAPGTAAAPKGLRSANVEWLGSVGSPGVVSATFVGSHMYLHTFHGLEVYDVSDPEAPVQVGELPLPQFQNEDVSTNGEILLISRDASLGLSRLYVVDIRDPARPSILSTLDTTDPKEPGGAIGHTASCLDGCRYAWLAGWSRGVDVVDLRDPANPKFAKPRKLELPLTSCNGSGRRAACFGTHDVQVDSDGIAWVAGAGGTVGYDVSDPLKPVRRYRTNAQGVSRYLTGRSSGGSGYNDFIHHNSVRRGRTVLITEEDFRAGCKGAGSLQSWRIGKDRVLRPLDKFQVERDPARASYCSAHYFDEREGLAVQGWYEAGARFIDVSRPRNLRQTGYWIPHRGNITSAYWAPTDAEGQIAYALDEAHGVDILRVDRAAAPVTRRPPRQGKRSGLASRPNLKVSIEKGPDALRPAATATYVVSVSSNRYATRANRALVELGRGLQFRSGGQSKTLEIPALKPGRGWQKRLRVQVARNAPTWVEAAVTLLVDDGDPADDFSVWRDTTRGTRKGRAASAPRMFCRLAARG